MKIKVLIVDDSRIFRSVLEESLAEESDIEVIGSVWNGVKALEFIRSERPDLITLDVEMPSMNGLETLKAIQKFNASNTDYPPIGVIMLSSFTRKGADITIKALETGAFDFIAKPEGKSLAESMKILHHQLLVKIRYFASRRLALNFTTQTAPAISVKAETTPIAHLSSRVKAILIAVSTGGPRTLADMLPQLCERIDIPIFIVQHMPPTFTQSLANSLNAKCRYTVTEAKENEIIQNRHVYIAPGGKHMAIRRKSTHINIVINTYPPENGYRPSADMLFRSAASVYRGDVIAIILTGMGTDGTKGAEILKRSGAYIIAQDEESSVVWGMPGSAKASGNVDEVLSLEKIPDAVAKQMYQH